MSVNKNFGAVVEAFNRLNRGDLTLAVAGGENASVFAQAEMKNTANLVRLGYTRTPPAGIVRECAVLRSALALRRIRHPARGSDALRLPGGRLDGAGARRNVRRRRALLRSALAVRAGRKDWRTRR